MVSGGRAWPREAIVAGALRVLLFQNGTGANLLAGWLLSDYYLGNFTGCIARKNLHEGGALARANDFWPLRCEYRCAALENRSAASGMSVCSPWLP
jgi:hypothetical protein